MICPRRFVLVFKLYQPVGAVVCPSARPVVIRPAVKSLWPFYHLQRLRSRRHRDDIRIPKCMSWANFEHKIEQFEAAEAVCIGGSRPLLRDAMHVSRLSRHACRQGRGASMVPETNCRRNANDGTQVLREAVSCISTSHCCCENRNDFALQLVGSRGIDILGRFWRMSAAACPN